MNKNGIFFKFIFSSHGSRDRGLGWRWEYDKLGNDMAQWSKQISF